MSNNDKFSRTAAERDEKSLEELREETVEALGIAFGNIEYLLGNADIKSPDTYSKLESLRAALSEMQEYLQSDQYKDTVIDRLKE